MNNQGNSQLNQHDIAVIGANGYSGRELVRLLLKHPNVGQITCFSRDPHWHISQELPEATAKTVECQPLSECQANADNFHTIFLATPTEASLELVPQLLQKQTNVIDLSGAFRLSPEEFKEWYQLSHTATEVLQQAQYGLCPWASIQPGNNTLVSNPGCYATAILMALMPLLKSKFIDPTQIVIDAKSGITGAGRAAKSATSFCEIADNCLPYKVGVHQHLPEIMKYSQAFASVDINPMMTTHLLPVKRGITAGIYCSVAAEFKALTKEQKCEQMTAAFTEAYGEYPLVKFAELKNTTEDRQVLALTNVVGSARTHIGYAVQGDHVYLYSSIDNLLKGAASQAIENLNQLLGLPLATALIKQEGVL